MKRKFSLKDSVLYRYRYPFALIVLALFVCTTVFYRLGDLPAGLSPNEAATVVSVDQFNPKHIFRLHAPILPHIAGLPWLSIELVSVQLLGRSVFAWRLPSALCAIIAVGLLVRLIWRMRKPALAIIAGFLFGTSATLLGVAHSATPIAFMMMLLCLSLLLGLTALSDQSRQLTRSAAKLGLCLAMTVLLYLPGGLIIDASFLLTALLHPRSRLIIKEHKLAATGWCLVLLLLLAPWVGLLAWDVITGSQAKLVSQLVWGGGTLWHGDTLATLGSALLGFVPWQGTSIIPAGMLTLVDVVLLAWGLWVILQSFSAVRSYCCLILLVALLVYGTFNLAALPLAFLPVTILAVLGLGDIIDRWYVLFPRNPYARTFALVPLTVLILSVGWFNVCRYHEALSYDKATVYSYNDEYQVAFDLTKDKRTLVLVVPDNQLELYLGLHSHRRAVIVAASAADQLRKSDFKENARMVVLGSADFHPDSKQLAERAVVAGWRKDKPILARVYYGDSEQ